jgi:hypothetical protein
VKKHQVAQVVRSEGGSAQRVEGLNELAVPDCWHVAERLNAMGSPHDASVVLETWRLCHDLLKHIRKLEARTKN